MYLQSAIRQPKTEIQRLTSKELTLRDAHTQNILNPYEVFIDIVSVLHYCSFRHCFWDRAYLI